MHQTPRVHKRSPASGQAPSKPVLEPDFTLLSVDENGEITEQDMTPSAFIVELDKVKKLASLEPKSPTKLRVEESRASSSEISANESSKHPELSLPSRPKLKVDTDAKEVSGEGGGAKEYQSGIPGIYTLPWTVEELELLEELSERDLSKAKEAARQREEKTTTATATSKRVGREPENSDSEHDCWTEEQIATADEESALRKQMLEGCLEPLEDLKKSLGRDQRQRLDSKVEELRAKCKDREEVFERLVKGKEGEVADMIQTLLERNGSQLSLTPHTDPDFKTPDSWSVGGDRESLADEDEDEEVKEVDEKEKESEGGEEKTVDEELDADDILNKVNNMDELTLAAGAVGLLAVALWLLEQKYGAGA